MNQGLEKKYIMNELFLREIWDLNCRDCHSYYCKRYLYHQHGQYLVAWVYRFGFARYNQKTMLV